MASVALGAQNGVSKKVKLTVVKASTEDHNSQEVTAEHWLDGLAQVYDAVSDGNKNGKAVLSMSWGCDLPAINEYNDALQDTFHSC